MEAPENDLTILFVDVSDSVRLYESLGDAVAFREVRECLTVFEEVAAGHHGRVVKTIGDGSMCVFPDVDSAMLAACEMQARLQQRTMPHDRQIEIRIGLHHGPVLLEGDDVYGDTVNTASRMAQFAAAGQIITTGETVAQLSPAHRNATRRLDALPVKGKHDEVTVHEVLWQASTDHTQMPGRIDTIIQRAGIARLRLLHAGREIIVVASITMGRHANNGIVLKDPMASRHHAFIERRKDKFVIGDQSSNGTFVAMKNGEEFKLRREEMVLYGSGAITFGHRARDKDAEIVGFWCESKNNADTPPPANPPSNGAS
ncbi:MAG: adenylate/guanylate cyclase domain-containing protein [Betaproteobacteria bacterium]|nr:adenylate/guanylate cyclase domain-containing protein [Betaproteobacteria bacterium]